MGRLFQAPALFCANSQKLSFQFIQACKRSVWLHNQCHTIILTHARGHGVMWEGCQNPSYEYPLKLLKNNGKCSIRRVNQNHSLSCGRFFLTVLRLSSAESKEGRYPRDELQARRREKTGRSRARGAAFLPGGVRVAARCERSGPNFPQRSCGRTSPGHPAERQTAERGVPGPPRRFPGIGSGAGGRCTW